MDLVYSVRTNLVEDGWQVRKKPSSGDGLVYMHEPSSSRMKRERVGEGGRGGSQTLFGVARKRERGQTSETRNTHMYTHGTCDVLHGEDSPPISTAINSPEL